MPYKGMMLTNPGGPGESGVQFLLEDLEVLLPVVGSNYDLVSWDPRGIGASIPAANCTLPSNVQRRALEPITGPHLPPVFYEDNYNQSIEIGIACGNSIGGKTQAGPHLTTATVVRDIISILDAYASSARGKTANNPSLLNYWGFSYGTIVGQTFASMFPHRLGRVVIDGVVNPDDWVQGTGQNFVTSTDEVFSTFFVYCNAAGSTNCPFAEGTTTAHEIYLRFESLVSNLDATYAYQQRWDNATAIQTLLSGIKFAIYSETYSPIFGFPVIAQILVAVESIIPNVTLSSLHQLEQELGVNFTVPVTVDSLWERAVMCTDTGGMFYGSPLSEILARYVPIEQRQSWLVGEYFVTEYSSCAGWPIVSDDRFAGPFHAKTNNPILFVSNVLDNITPYQNGVNGTTRFPGSELLTIEGTGHSSLGPQNACAWGKINTFLQTGQLPGTDNYCALEAGAWNITLPGPLSRFVDKRNIMERPVNLRN